MGRFNRTEGNTPAARRANVKALRKADAALHANRATDENDPEYLRLNGAANQAAAKVSRWRGGTR